MIRNDASRSKAAPSSESPGGLSLVSLSKITPPVTPEAVPTARLFGLLDRALRKPIVWLQGLPGAGKTTLVTSYLMRQGIDPIWYRLDPDDDVPSNFFFYLSVAITRAQRHKTSDLPVLTGEPLPDANASSRQFFQKLFDSVSPLTLVLDDYNEIATNSAVHSCLAEGLKQVTAHARVIVISRTSPPNHLARLRINGLIEVVGPAVLRLEAAEAVALARHRSLTIGNSVVESLVERTHGWTAGLILMIEAAIAAGSSVDASNDTVPELISSYFLGEILNRLEQPAETILLTLSLLPTMTVKSAIMVTEEPAAERMLRTLALRNYFTERGDQEASYRFHPLFQNFLKARARDTFSPEQYTLLRLRAARTLEACGEPEAAIPILHECQAWDDLARIVLLRSKGLVEEGRFQTLASWIDRLPNDFVAASGWLSFWAATAKAAFRPSMSRVMFGHALARFEEAKDASGVFMAWAGLADAINQDAFADQAELDGDIDLLRDLVRRYPTFPSVEIEVRVAVVMFIALGRRSHDRLETATWRDRACRAAAAAGKPELLDLIRCFQIILYLTDGEFSLARQMLDALTPPESLRHAPLLQEAAYVARAYAQLSRQMTGACGETAETAIAFSEQSGIFLWTHLLAIFAATDAFQRSDLAQGKAWLRRAAQLSYRRTGQRDADHLGAPYHVSACNLALLDGDVSGALTWGRAAVDIAVRGGWLSYEALARLALSEALDESGELDAADEQLALARIALDRSSTATLEFGIRLLEADFLLRRGWYAEARGMLVEAMVLGARTEARRTCLTPARATRLLAFALSENIAPDYALLLVRAGGLPPPKQRIEQWPWPLKIRTLGGFQIFKDGEPLVFSRKMPRRLFHLLKAVIVFGGKDVLISRIVDAVWPDEDGDAGNRSFDVAIHRLRKMIGDSQTIVVRNGRVSLHPDRSWLDVWAFEEAMNAQDDDRREEGLRLYKGAFLLGDEDLSWTETRRHQIDRLYFRVKHELQGSQSRNLL